MRGAHPLNQRGFLSKALAKGFNLNSLKHGEIGPSSTRNIPYLSVYHRWSTRQLFESVCEKNATLKHAATLGNSREPDRLDEER